jgi:glutamine synthetase
LAQNHIIPAAIKYQSVIIENVRGLKEILSAADFKKSSSTQLRLITDISEHLTGVKIKIDELRTERRKADTFGDVEKTAFYYADILFPIMNAIREHSDRLEMLVDDEMWPMPKLREILFNR